MQGYQSILLTLKQHGTASGGRKAAVTKASQEMAHKRRSDACRIRMALASHTAI